MSDDGADTFILKSGTMKFELMDEAESPTDYSRLREGICPFCDVALVRHDDFGRCPRCTTRWSLTGDTINVHIIYPDPLGDQK